MEYDQDSLLLLEKLSKNSKRQTLFAGLQCAFALCAAACIVLLSIAVVQFVPQVETLVQRADMILEDLEKETSRLGDLELESLLEDVDALVATGQEGVEDAMDKLNGIDTDKLNQAIIDFDSVVNDLSTIIEPLKKVAGLFK